MLIIQMQSGPLFWEEMNENWRFSGSKSKQSNMYWLKFKMWRLGLYSKYISQSRQFSMNYLPFLNLLYMYKKEKEKKKKCHGFEFLRCFYQICNIIAWKKRNICQFSNELCPRTRLFVEITLVNRLPDRKLCTCL
jgi:hypothetical protein